MAQPKFNWKNAAIILAVGAGLIMLLVTLGGSELGLLYPSAH